MPHRAGARIALVERTSRFIVLGCLTPLTRLSRLAAGPGSLMPSLSLSAL